MDANETIVKSMVELRVGLGSAPYSENLDALRESLDGWFGRWVRESIEWRGDLARFKPVEGVAECVDLTPEQLLYLASTLTSLAGAMIATRSRTGPALDSQLSTLDSQNG